jgi:hypothetical protein
MVMDQLRTELLELQATSADNILHVQKAVDWAKDNPNSALHQRLDWNDATAANHWRCEQMRGLIRYHVRTETGAPEVISLQVDRSSGGGYRDINEARTSMAEIMLREAVRTLKMIRMRFGHVKKLQGVWREIDRVVEASPVRRPANDQMGSRRHPAA